jgi:hypothetical protein
MFAPALPLPNWTPWRAATSGTGVKTTDPMDGAPEDVPDEVIAQAKAAFAGRRRGEIAILVWDSLVDEDAPAEDHRLRFEHADMQIDVRVLAGGDFTAMEGHVQPPSALQVELQAEQGRPVGHTDIRGGVFAFDHVPPGVVRLSFQRPASSEVHTDWFRT